MNDINTKQWLNQMNLDHPLVIAGPCSAETEQQVLETAQSLKDSDVSIFRAGIWKPRTRPGGFEGVGAIGLKWLQKAKETTGLKIGTEVANATHVRLALEHDVDMLWIGARSAANPFTVQEIAHALKGTDKIVLLKNPVNPDLSLWVGGLERLLSSDIKNIGVIHRGFSTFNKLQYRNNPKWHIAIDFKNQYPNVPILVDPSHITGRRDMIFDVTQQALDMNFDGMMIETHPDPDNAWSDAAQQVTPDALKAMFDNLRVRKPDDSNDVFQKKMSELRAKIDELDSKLITNLGIRMRIANEIGTLKKSKNVAILQSNRWNQILSKMQELGASKDLSEEFIAQIFKAIHQESINHQEKVFKEN